MALRWSVKPRDAWGDLSAAYVAAIRRGVRAIADRYAPEIEAYMKDNAVWTDQSSNARQSLTARVEDMALNMVEIQLAHGVDYGIYLELANAGRFAIVNPTLDIYGPRVWRDVRALLR